MARKVASECQTMVAECIEREAFVSIKTSTVLKMAALHSMIEAPDSKAFTFTTLMGI